MVASTAAHSVIAKHIAVIGREDNKSLIQLAAFPQHVHDPSDLKIQLSYQSQVQGSDLRQTAAGVPSVYEILQKGMCRSIRRADRGCHLIRCIEVVVGSRRD